MGEIKIKTKQPNMFNIISTIALAALPLAMAD